MFRLWWELRLNQIRLGMTEIGANVLQHGCKIAGTALARQLLESRNPRPGGALHAHL